MISGSPGWMGTRTGVAGMDLPYRQYLHKLGKESENMNKVILIGRLTRDPEVRYTTTQKVCCQFTLAVDRPFLNREGKREADFITVVLWGKAAELAGNSCAKGHRLCVEGRMQVRTYIDKSERTVWVTEVVGERIEFLEKKSNAAAAGDVSAPAMNKDAFSGMGEEIPCDEEVPF